MGKLAKQKKRKLLNALEPEETLDVSPSDLEVTVKTLSLLSKNRAVLQKKEFKVLRTVLFDFQTKSGSAVGAVSDALREKRFHDAIALLEQMQEDGKIPKLGALQRWTRDCDAAGHDGRSLEVESVGEVQELKVLRALDAILRTTDPEMVGVATPGKKAEHPIRMFPDWSPNGGKFHVPPPMTENDGILPQNMIAFKPFLHDFNTVEASKQFKMIYKEKGSDRMPPNGYDMNLYTSMEDLISFPESEPVTRVDVPNLPGVFVLRNVLSPEECMRIISVAEHIGFTPDVPTGGSAKDFSSILAHNFFWLADESFLNHLFQRCLPFLPPTIGNGNVCGLNSRFRVYRYTPGSIYRPHIDGAWPGSGLTSKGDYIYDAYGDRWSKLTFLVRLNDNFMGGATTYFTPSVDVGYLDAQPLRPFMGDVLVFPHGDTHGTLLHEGSAVLSTNGEFGDAKYVIRTEVLYSIPGHEQKVLE